MYSGSIYGVAAPSTFTRLDTIQNAALSVSLGVMCSSPVVFLHAESGVPPLATHKREVLCLPPILSQCYVLTWVWTTTPQSARGRAVVYTGFLLSLHLLRSRHPSSSIALAHAIQRALLHLTSKG
ncbi:hypothetical protein E2C01_008706 [Portunus trituberculatus]|uniref:Uncharacterized protein n=1 Tax=Portunus trituberculatus TaxID=210409 RepID=A0A5B7D5K7_PORTR|nr:hypothetical protein [Portunus trituberculatus]